MSDDIDIDIDSLSSRMDGALTAMRRDFTTLRTGRASASMLDAVHVEAYGARTPLAQVATINVPEPRMVTVNVWDKSMVEAVDKAIRVSGLGLNPMMDGTMLRLPIPELNAERRKEMAKLCGTYAENAKIAARNVRRDGMDQIKKAKNDGMSEDDQKVWQDEIQDITDAAIKKIDAALEVKQAEIMQV
ncbi:MAG TPA: ribosome recycling factor [Rhodobacteraceae bacterium]|nr:ribosome recycling factor [Paracoccaceae bacterium]